MRKNYLLFCLIFLITCCKLDTNDVYKSTINEILNPNSSNLSKIQDIGDVRNMNGCQFLIEKRWVVNKFGGGVSMRWIDGSLDIHGGIGFDDPKDSTPYLTTHPIYHIIYIGPWHYVKRIDKEIRFVAYTGIGGGDIRYQYESKTKENENIKEKSYNLPAKKITAPRSSICLVKWIANHGYNAIAEVEYKGFFNKIFRHTPTPTGKIIEVKE